MVPSKCSAQKTISYGDFNANFWLWQRAILMVPLWAIVLIPVIGFIARLFGPTSVQLGFALVLVLCANYFLEDLLKRKIRMDDDYLYFGFKVFPIREIVGISVTYGKRKLLPKELLVNFASGRSLKLRLNALSADAIETMLKHVQARNPDMKTAPVLSTVVKCRRTSQKQTFETSERLLVPYHANKDLEETTEAFMSSARQWTRLGPLMVCIICGPIWMATLSAVYLCLQPNAISDLQSLNLYKFLEHCLSSLQYAIGMGIRNSSETMSNITKTQIVTVVSGVASLALAVTMIGRTVFRPNWLLADSNGLSLRLRIKDFSIPIRKVRWSQLSQASLRKIRRQGSNSGSIMRLSSNNGKHLDIDLSAMASEDKVRLIKRLESSAPACEIDSALTQVMMPKSDHSYTELWLQSLTQSPERQTLDPLQPGQLVGEGRFQVTRRLGVGGQGTAYLCQSVQDSSSSTIVLKETILPVFAEGTVRRKALESFEQEARLLQSLQDNRVVKLLDYFIEDHRAYLVLEHIDGQSLREFVLQEGPLSNERVRELALQMCQILSVLHERSIIHRDFTPDNLILNSRGTLKLIDFNVAQTIKEGSSGTIVGKHSYLPPEQFRGKPTLQSDLYAMGATMHFLLTGQDPEPISQSSPGSINSAVAEDLDQIVRKATALQCEKRTQSAKEIEEALCSPAVGADIIDISQVREKKEFSTHG